MGERLARRIEAELREPVAHEVETLVAEIRRRHGTAVVAVLFYGSCLRRRSAEGVLDFYVLVETYRSAYRGRGAWALALLNAALPPNVLYVEIGTDEAALRAKYAVMTLDDFVRRSSGRGLDARVWARFCQPARLAYARDEGTRRSVVAAVTEATLTMTEWAWTWLPDGIVARPVEPAELWLRAFRETYRAEPRSERAEAIEALYRSEPGRYDAVAREAFAVLARRGRLRPCGEALGLRIAPDAVRRRRALRVWRLRRPIAKLLAVVGVAKTALTFDDWVSYAIWKLERQSGQRIEVSERQRRHPLLLGWPVLLRLVRRRVLR